MKFKVGDKVKDVRKYVADNCGWVSSMDKCIGKEFTVERITPLGNYEFEETCWSFPPESLELVPPITIDEIKQKIAELQDAVKRLKEAKEEDNSVVVDEEFIKDHLVVRVTREYADKAIFLSDSFYDWELKKDSGNFLCLIPTKKGVAK